MQRVWSFYSCFLYIFGTFISTRATNRRVTIIRLKVVHHNYIAVVRLCVFYMFLWPLMRVEKDTVDLWKLYIKILIDP